MGFNFGSILRGAGRSIRDVFDANTAEDQRKRLAQGQPRYYQQQSAVQKTGNAIANLSSAVVKTNPIAVMNRFNSAAIGAVNRNLGNKLQSGQNDIEAGLGRYIADTPKTGVQLYGALNDLANDNPLYNAIHKDRLRDPNSMSSKVQTQAKRNTAAAFKGAKDMGAVYDKGNLVNARDNWTYKIANAVPSTVESAGLYAINPALGQTVAGARTYANTAAESYDKTGKVNQTAALTDAGVTAALEKIQPSNILKIANRAGGKEVEKAVVKEAGNRGIKLVKDFVKGAAAEGFQEGSQQLASNVVAKLGFDKNRDVTQGVVESAGIGALLGSGTNVATGAMTGDYRKGKATAKETVQEAAKKAVVESKKKPTVTVAEQAKANLQEQAAREQANAPVTLDNGFSTQDVARMDAVSRAQEKVADASARPPDVDIKAANAYLDNVATVGTKEDYDAASATIQQKIDETKAAQAAYDDSLKYRDKAPKPETVKIDGKNVDPLTGEVTKPTFMEGYNKKRVYTNKGQVFDAVANAADPKTAGVAEAEQAIGDITRAGQEHVAKVEQKVAEQGHTFEEFSREIQSANREDRDAAPWADTIYNNELKPSLDEARRFSGKDTGEQRYYMPQQRPGAVLETNVGGTLVDLLDIGNEGFAKTRENRLSMDEMDHSPTQLNGYFTQTASAAYSSQLNSKYVANQIEQQTGKAVTEEQVKAVQDAQIQLTENILTAAEKSGGIAKLNLMDQLLVIGELKGREQIVLDDSLHGLKNTVSSSEEIYGQLKYPNGKTLGDQNGFTRYNEADGTAYGVLEDMQGTGLTAGQHLLTTWQDVNVDEDTKTKIADKVDKKMAQVDQQEKTDQANYQELQNVDPSTLSRREKRAYNKLLERYKKASEGWSGIDGQSQRALVIRNAERSIARQQMVDFLETTKIQSKRLKKLIQNDSTRMLVQDKINQSKGKKFAEGLTGILHTGYLGYSLTSALQNITELTRAAAIMDAGTFARANKSAMADKNGDILTKYGVRPTNQFNIEEIGTKDPSTKLSRPLGMFNKSESFKDKVFLYGLEEKYRKQGYSGVELAQKVRREFDKFAIKAGMAGTLGFNKTNTGKIFGQFMQYSVKDAKITLDQMKMGFYGGKDITDRQSQDARHYLYKNFGARVPMYLLLHALFGASWEYVMGFFNPLDSKTIVDSNASTAEKVVAQIPGGPAIGMLKDAYMAYASEARAADEENRAIEYKNFITNTIKKDAAAFFPGGNQIFNRTVASVQDMQRGYNENQQGRARWVAPTFENDPVNAARSLVFGKNSTEQAQEYRNTNGIAGDAVNALNNLTGNPLKKEKKYPVTFREQDKINASPKDQVANIIATSRERQVERAKFERENPQSRDTIAITKKRTKEGTKLVSDVLSPEKWRTISSDTSGKSYDRLKQIALNNKKDFGDQIDPIYELKDKNKVREVMGLRSVPTGDEIEKQQILRATTDWYPAFEKQLIKYYESSDYKVDPDSPLTDSKRKAAWINVVKEQAKMYDNQPTYVTEYYKLKDSDPAAAKQYFKNNADQLSNYFDTTKEKRLGFINEQRKLEGYDPIDKTTFDNVTFGYEADEKKVYNELKYGKGYGAYSKKSRVPGSGFANLPTVKSKKTSSKPRAAVKLAALQKVTISKAKVGRAKVTSKKSLV